MKLALAALLLFSSVPAAQAYESQGGYAREQKCFKKVYKETYVPGTMKNPGYVKTEKKRVRVPCNKTLVKRFTMVLVTIMTTALIEPVALHRKSMVM